MNLALSQKLKEWRQNIAQKEGVELYRVLSNEAIEAIVEIKPKTEKELISIKGIKMHNDKKVCSTQFRTPFELIYYEAHHNKYDAAEREKFLKTGWGRNWIKKTLKYFYKSKS